VSASEKLKALAGGHERVIPVFRKTGPHHEGADSFSRARDIEAVMDVLPLFVAVVEAIEWALENDDGDGPPTMRVEDALAALEKALP
jgi:hypothetical protein